MREQVSPNLFAMLGAKTELGRGFVAEQPGFGAVKNVGSIVLSDQVWHAAFGGDPNIVGKVVRVNDQPYTVVGVMPAGFSFPASTAVNGQVWATIKLDPNDNGRDYKSGYYSVIGKLRRGVDGGRGAGGDGERSRNTWRRSTRMRRTARITARSRWSATATRWSTKM